MPLQQKQCKTCREFKPATRDYFGSTPSGGLRNECRTCKNKKSKAYAKKNPDSVLRRSVKRHEQADHWIPTKELKTRLAVEQKGRCALCGEPIDKDGLFDATKVQVEHLTPVSKGGTNDESNLVIAHRTCNQEKAGKTMRQYWRWRKKVGLPEISYATDKVIAAITRIEG